MELNISEQHAALRDAARDFARTTVAPGAEARDNDAAFPYELIPQLGQRRWMGIPFGAEIGGLGADTLAFVLAVEELARVDSALAATVSAHTWQGTMPIHLWGSEDQKARWLPWLCSGQRLAAFGASPGAQPTRTRGELTDGSWSLNGAEHAVANGGTGLSACLTATVVTGEGEGRPELSSLIVPTNAPGYGIGAPHRSIGWRAVDLRPISFENCEVEEAALLGPRGAGLGQYLQIIDGNRLGLAAIGVGLAQGALDEAGSEIAGRANVPGAHASAALDASVADLSQQVAAARALTWQAALERDHGKPFALTAAAARLAGGRLALAATEVAMQARGGFGEVDAGAAWRLFRDARMLAASDASEEMQQAAIASRMGAGNMGAAPDVNPTPVAKVSGPSPTAVPPKHLPAITGPAEVGHRTPSAPARSLRGFLATEAGLAVGGVGLGVLICLVLLASWRV